MVGDVHSSGWTDLGGLTRSCDTFPRYDRPCFRCTSCLYTELALQDHGHYKAISEATSKGPGARAWYAMERQARRIEACLCARNPWAAMVAESPDLCDVHDAIVSEDVQGQLVALYRCHAAEWKPFSDAVRRSAGKRCA